MPFKVFLSYASEDRWVAAQLRRRLLEAPGVDVWWDETEMRGRRVMAAIREGLKACDEVVLVLTPTALTRDYVRHEMGMADMRELPITLLLYGVSGDALPATWADLARMDINAADDYVARVHARAAEGER